MATGRVLLGLPVAAFAADGPLLVGIGETVERRRGAKIAAKGISRDPVRSSHSHFVKASGLRWVCLMLLVPIPWAGRTWALPFLTALAPSERYDRQHGRRHKALTDWARRLLLTTRRWWPDRPLVAVADATYAALGFLAACRAWPNPVTVVTRLRLDAALSEPAPPRLPRQVGRPRRKGRRRPTLMAVAADAGTAGTPITVADWYGRSERDVEVVTGAAVWSHPGLPPVPLRWVLLRDPQGRFATQALPCTDPAATPEQIPGRFVQRWRLEAAFEAARRHLGVETQRQRSARAIRRTTPALLGLFSLVTLLAHPHVGAADCVRQAAWYRKPRPTSADALASVRRQLWGQPAFCTSPDAGDVVEAPRAVLNHLTEALAYAA